MIEEKNAKYSLSAQKNKWKYASSLQQSDISAAGPVTSILSWSSWLIKDGFGKWKRNILVKRKKKHLRMNLMNLSGNAWFTYECDESWWEFDESWWERHYNSCPFSRVYQRVLNTRHYNSCPFFHLCDQCIQIKQDFSKKLTPTMVGCLVGYSKLFKIEWFTQPKTMVGVVDLVENKSDYVVYHQWREKLWYN